MCKVRQALINLGAWVWEAWGCRITPQSSLDIHQATPRMSPPPHQSAAQIYPLPCLPTNHISDVGHAHTHFLACLKGVTRTLGEAIEGGGSALVVWSLSSDIGPTSSITYTPFPPPPRCFHKSCKSELRRYALDDVILTREKKLGSGRRLEMGGAPLNSPG